MEILNAYDLTGSYRAAAELCGCSHHTVKKAVDDRDAGLPLATRRARMIDDLYLKKAIFIHNFANDLPVETATLLWATQRTASTAAFETPATQAAWKTIPSWYFISTGDQIITPTSENAMAARAHSQVTTYNDGSHQGTQSARRPGASRP